jgi:Leucine-rich repeat (LRR) protein
MAKDCNQSITTNKYLRYLTKFGCSDKISEILDYKTPTIKIIGMEIPTLPNLTKFTNLKQIILLSNRIEAIHPSIGEIKSLEVLIIAENNITELPREIGNLKNLLFLNITKK